MKGPIRKKARLVDVLGKNKVEKEDRIRINSNEEGTYLLEKM